MRQTFTRVVSLGRDCRVGFQIRRHFGKAHCIASVFDRQVTPYSALVEYLRRDFHGMFERDDLQMIDAAHVRNTRYGTAHLHEFKADINNEYHSARSRHDQLCDNVRRVIAGTAPTLFVANATDGEKFTKSVSLIIRAMNPNLPFDVVTADDSLPPTRAGIHAWKGNDDLWSRTFEPFRIASRPIVTLAAHTARLFGHLRVHKF